MYYYVHHTSLFQRNTGIQRSVRAIARGLISCGVALRPLVWDAENAALVPASDEALQHLSRWNGPSPDTWCRGSFAPDWLLVPELTSGPMHPQPEQWRQLADHLGLRLAWIFHDALPLRRQELYGGAGERAAFLHARYMEGLAAADLVLANSQTTAQHLRQFLQERQLPWQHVEPLPLAAELPGVDRRIPDPDAVVGDERLLCVGSLEPRKNHVGLLRALAWLKAQGRWRGELWLAGWANDVRVVRQVERAQALGLPVRWQAEVSDAELLEMYQSCDATVFPSLEEGFGLPIAESLWMGKPCICSGDGAIGELAAAGGCTTVNTSSWIHLAEALLRWQCDAELRRRLLSELVSRSLRTWRDYATELLQRLDSNAAVH